jgi:hypothetical protein
MSTTLSSFNDLMQQFLDELEIAFPDDPKLKKHQSNFSILKKANVRKPLNSFMDAVTPHANKIMAKDESYFFEADDKFIKELDIQTKWANCSENTKSAIWQYLQTLYIIGTTIKTLPTDALSMIEDVAKKCADSFNPDDMSSLIELLGKNPVKK